MNDPTQETKQLTPHANKPLFPRLVNKIRRSYQGLKASVQDRLTPQPPCNICGGRSFSLGPNGRKGAMGTNPRCNQCHSLERHRVQRLIWDQLPRQFFADKKALHFSPDSAVEAAWFLAYEPSIYGKENSLDIQNINRPDAHYDIVICSHVLEHVPNDQKALAELLRVTKSSGFVMLAVPAPLDAEKTQDWGYPDPAQHGHYRIYGADIAVLLDAVVGKECWQQIVLADPVTSAQNCAYILSRSKQTHAELSRFFASA